MKITKNSTKGRVEREKRNSKSGTLHEFKLLRLAERRTLLGLARSIYYYYFFIEVT